jgi:hypothetical protein
MQTIHQSFDMSSITKENETRMHPIPLIDSVGLQFPIGGLMEGKYVSEKSNRDETEMARFGKKQQLKVQQHRFAQNHRDTDLCHSQTSVNVMVNSGILDLSLSWD